MQPGLHEQSSDNIDLRTHLTTSTYSFPQEQIFQSHQQIRSTEQSSHHKLPSQKQQTGEQTNSYTDQGFYGPYNPNNQTIKDFHSEKHKAASSCIVQTFKATNGSYESGFLVPEASTFPQPKLHPYMQPTFSMHQQTRINAASIASGPSCNNAFLPDNREQRSNPHQSANYFLQPSLIQTISPQTTLPEFKGQVSNFPQLTTCFDINRDNRDKIDFKTTVKLPPIQIPSFDGNPLAFHDWLNIFNATVDSNTTISDTQNYLPAKRRDW